MTQASRIFAVLIVAVTAAGAGAFCLFDYDLGLARATGRWILENGGVPRTNVFSAIHEQFPFVDDKWLFHVIAYLVVDGISATVGVLLRVALLVATFALLLPRRDARPLEQACGALFCVLAIATAHERFAFRPELITFLCLAVLARRLRDPTPLSRGDWFGLLAMQWVWTQSHGYFVLGPILAGAVGAGALLDAKLGRGAPFDRARWREALLLPLGLALIGVANPYGVDLLLSPVRILADLRGHEATFKATIVEFVPPFAYFDRTPSDLVAFRVLLGATALALLLAVRRVRLRDLLPLAALFVMALDLRRNTAPFSIVAAPLAAAWLARSIPARAERWCSRALFSAAGLAGGVLVFLFATDRIHVHDRLDRTRGFGESTSAHPDAEIEFLRAQLEPGPIFNSFTFGSYFVGRAFPAWRPFLDGNTAGYPPEFLTKYVAAVRGELEPWDLVTEYGFVAFLVRPGHALTRQLLADSRFAPLFLGRHAVVIVVKERAPSDLVARHDLRGALQRGDFVPVATTPEPTFWRATFPVAELNRARLEYALDLKERAEATLVATLERSPAWSADAFELWHLLGLVRLARGARSGALEALDRAHEIASGSAEIEADRAIVLAALTQHDAARAALEHAIELRGEDFDLAERSSQLAFARRDLDGARSALRRALELAPNAAARDRIAERLRQIGG
jgi:tetratricopeptide (TPR) repeat protein